MLYYKQSITHRKDTPMTEKNGMQAFETTLSLIVEVQERQDIVDDYLVRSFNIHLSVPSWDIIQLDKSPKFGRVRRSPVVTLQAERLADEDQRY